MENAATGLIEAGRQALSRGAWEEARTHFQRSIAADATALAWELLGLASWWLDDAAGTFDARERAYQLYRDANDARGAARVALWLVWDYLAFRGDTAVASGWLERSRRILEGHETSTEYGLLLLREGEVALFRGHDPAGARARAVRAANLGRELGDLGLEFTALALEGFVDGMRCLDEATAAATAAMLACRLRGAQQHSYDWRPNRVQKSRRSGGQGTTAAVKHRGAGHLAELNGRDRRRLF